MVVSRFVRCDTPMMLLTNLPVENLKDAKQILRYYMRRWDSLSQEPGESRKDSDLPLVRDSAFGSAGCACDGLFRLDCRGISEYW